MNDYIYPPSDVEDCVNNKKLQNEIELPEELKVNESNQCENCKGANLKWYRFVSPKETWQMLCGRDAWLLMCPKCKKQYQEDIRIMN